MTSEDRTGDSQAVEAAAVPRRRPCIWAIGGGKGGVGKSVATSSLAFALASGGPRCAVVDADLGGANLHTLLGVPRPRATLSDFLLGRVAELSDVMTPTPVPNLWLVSGARAPLDGANPHTSQKQRLLRHLHRLDVAHVLVDLGAGSSFNVLDPFLAADRRLIVVNPEPTSIENAYHFLKAAFFRSLRDLTVEPSARQTLKEVVEATRGEALSPRDLLDAVMRSAPQLGALLQQRARDFAPYLLVNQVDGAEDRCVGFEMSAASRRHLGARLRYVGPLTLDAAVPTAVARQQPVLQLFPGSAYARSVHEALGRILRDEPLDASTAPPVWRLRRDEPPVATHGLGPAAIALPRLPRRSEIPPLPIDLPAANLDRPGESLRRMRLLRGLSVEQMIDHTRIRGLDAIEREEFAALPPAPYLRAQVREYARALGIHEADALADAYLTRMRATGLPPVGLLARMRRAARIEVLPRRRES